MFHLISKTDFINEILGREIIIFKVSKRLAVFVKNFTIIGKLFLLKNLSKNCKAVSGLFSINLQKVLSRKFKKLFFLILGYFSLIIQSTICLE